MLSYPRLNADLPGMSTVRLTVTIVVGVWIGTVLAVLTVLLLAYGKANSALNDLELGASSLGPALVGNDVAQEAPQPLGYLPS